jgi:hypothetical protein
MFTLLTFPVQQMEIAKLALPVLITRADAILRRYAAEDRKAAESLDTTELPGDHPSRMTVADDLYGNCNKQCGTSSLPASVTGYAVDATEPLPTISDTSAALSLLTDKARHVADLMMQLKVAPAVMDAAVVALIKGPQLRPWLDVSRARRKRAVSANAVGHPGAGGLAAAAGIWPGSSGLQHLPLSRSSSGSSNGGSSTGNSAVGMLDRREQTHLLALYGALCEAVSRRDAVVRKSAGTMLEQIGRDVGILDSSSLAPSSLNDA